MACGARLGGFARSDERKPVTILFTDVAGSTALGERLEPEAVRRVMLRYFEAASAVVERHGGTVEKFIGDAVMAVFGVPTALEDHARAGGARGARAAGGADAAERRAAAPVGRPDRDPHRRQQRRGRGRRRVRRPGARDRRRRQRRGAPAAGRRRRRDPDRRRHPAAGRRGARGRGGRAAVGARQGRAADGLAAGRHRASGAPRTLGPLQGREPELRQLREAFERVAYERSPQRVVAARARPASASRGSRARSARRSPSAPPCSSGAACPTARASPSGRSAEIVRQLAGERGSARRARGARSRTTRAPSWSPTGCCRPRASRRRRRRARTSRGAVRDLFAALARERPVVLVLEDLHWAEPALLDLVEHLLEHTTDAPLMLVCLARQELIEQRPAVGARDPRLRHCSSSGRCRRPTRAR